VLRDQPELVTDTTTDHASRQPTRRDISFESPGHTQATPPTVV